VKVLLADDDRARAASVIDVLSQDPSLTVVQIAPGEMLADAVTAHRPDVVLVDMTRPDRDALEGLRVLARQQPHPVVLFVDEDDPAFMEDAIAAGILSYNVGTVAAAAVKPVLRAAVALFRRDQGTRAALQEAETKLWERDILDRAKALLMRERRMTEPQAHRWLQRQAMEAGRRLPEVARRLLEGEA
jgi:two-component system, response regulator / RNA-binding antiterminator